ncbi:MAG: pyridoxamine 5'-phosphate oxidase family protein [Haloferacaceae archaeon]
MSSPTHVEMDREAMEEFLASTGLGTLSFGGDGGYGVPMSFGYDRRDDRCLFQFLDLPESEKLDRLADDPRVTLSVFEVTGTDEWRSVLVHGELTRLGPTVGSRAATVFARNAEVPSLQMFGGPIDHDDLVWYELDVERMSGRESPGRDEG